MNVRDLPIDLPADAVLERPGTDHRDPPYRIEWAEGRTRRDSAGRLLESRYAWRGYAGVRLPSDQTVDRMTLTATDGRATVGTITIGMDGPAGLAAADTFPEEIAALRARGLRLCEFSRLAAEPSAGGKHLLATLFHVAYLVAHRIRGADTLVMEVNPRHVGFYCRMLGARVLARGRINRTVNAPAVLLQMDFADVTAELAAFGGRPERAATCRSLYPLAMSAEQEARMVARLVDAQPGTAAGPY